MQFVDDVNSNKPVYEINKRTFHTKFGFDIKLERRDPYGFVHIVWPSGRTPDVLSGAYSDWDKARQALTNYLDLETFNKIVDEPVEFEKAKIKQKRG